MKAGANYHYFHTDHLGTPQKLTAKGGATTWAANYSGFGAATVNTSTVTNPIRFPGQYYDSETGLHQNFMRDYDPEVGAYLEQDPYGILTGPNRYGYVYGDPVGLSDPTGEHPAVIPILVAAGVIYTGIEAYDCAQYLWDPCLYANQIGACGSAALNAAITIATFGTVTYAPIIASSLRNLGVLKRVRGLPGFGRLGGFFGRFLGGTPKFPKQLSISDAQFGSKIRKKIRNPFSPRARYRFRDRIQRIFNNADEIRRGRFRGQSEEVFFFRRGRDVVLTKSDGEFITILTDGATNKRFLNATIIK